jgi:hypothetical protein
MMLPVVVTDADGNSLLERSAEDNDVVGKVQDSPQSTLVGGASGLAQAVSF